MNLYIKYGPIFYTITTRIKLFSDIVYYLGTFILPPIIVIIYLGLINNDFIFIIKYSILYIYLYCIFEIFYEIGYIINDAFCKKEKNKTKRIKENIQESFWIKQIVIRLILGILLLSIINIGTENLLFFIANILFMGIIFSIHNKIRNYSINIFTRIFLRASKLALLILLLKITGLEPESYKILLLSTLMYYVLDFFGSWIYQYNLCLGGTNNLKYGYCYFFLLIVFILFSILFEDIEMLLPIILILPKIILFIIKEPHAFSIKNDR